MRVHAGVFAGLIASFALLGACAREPVEGAYVDEQAIEAAPAPEPIPLAGGPSPSARAAASQANEDAYIARLASKGLMAERRVDPQTGRSILVISNRPVPNPVLFGGPNSARRHARAGTRVRSGTLGGGVPTAASPRPAASPSPAAPGPVEQPAAPIETAQAAPMAAPAPAPVEPAPVANPARAGFEMTPTLWGVAGAILLALLALLFFANRPKRKTRYSSHQAPAEASGGEAHA